MYIHINLSFNLVETKENIQAYNITFTYKYQIQGQKVYKHALICKNLIILK